ncbi:MAG TPA: heme o synthase [Candidatus Saccharimonadales bacterium]
MKTLKLYYRLTKPGIIYGNTLTVIGGFLFSFGGDFNLQRFLGVVAGVALVIASGCVTNNYLDRNIDRHMSRTKKRALVTGVISTGHALGFATILGIAGTVVLYMLTNTLTTLLALFAWFSYVVLYGYSKRRSVQGTLVGSIAGSMPVVLGYTANTAVIDQGAVLLFLIMVFWQMPHFYAIAMRRRDEYAAAGLPVLPVKSSLQTTKIHILAYVVAFILGNVALFLAGYAGYSYLIIMSGLGVFWLVRGVQGFKAKDSIAWAKGMFLYSLIVLLAFSLMIAVNFWLP